MKKTILMALALVGMNAMAQEVPSDSTNGWTVVGQNTLMLNQAAFSNWVGGGANNIGWIAGTKYNMTYVGGNDLWENNIVLGYGQTNTKGVGTRKTQDVINLSTNYGRKLSDSWYASAGASLETQFAPGYDYAGNSTMLSNKFDSEGHKKTSSFMAPGYVMVGAGFTYKPNEKFTATLRPANARWTLVMDKDLQKEGNFGLKHNGDSSLFQFGFLGTAMYRVQLMDNVTLDNSASVFSNYLDHPDRLVLGYNGTLNMKLISMYLRLLLLT